MKARNALVVAATAAVVLFAAAANAAEAKGVKLKVTGVAVVDDTYEGKSGAKFLPPETRVVVPSDKQLALFRVEYDIPTNMKADEEIRHRGLSHGAHPRRRRQKVGKTGYRRGGAAEYVKHLKSFRK